MTRYSVIAIVAGLATSPALWGEEMDGGDVCVPGNQRAAIPETATEYAEMCGAAGSSREVEDVRAARSPRTTRSRNRFFSAVGRPPRSTRPA